MKRPGKSDPSRPREDGYDYKRDFYRSSQVAEDYDFHRFSTPERQKRNARKWAAIRKALRAATGVRTILDLPCGTGRFTGALAREGFEIVGSDISLEMLRKAAVPGTAEDGRRTAARDPRLRAGERRAAAAAQRFARLRRLHPLHDARRSRDARAHAARVRARLAPLGHRRLSPQVHVPLRAHAHVRQARPGPHAAVARVDAGTATRSSAQAGFAIRRVIRVSTPLLSDKWVVLAERA